MNQQQTLKTLLANDTVGKLLAAGLMWATAFVMLSLTVPLQNNEYWTVTKRLLAFVLVETGIVGAVLNARGYDG